ncbi:MAG: hypothetical protein LBQ82_08710 [Treponema sp.]|jgi:hypothetical protein|nr:hypothetical protein [Treponema sp.]
MKKFLVLVLILALTVSAGLAADDNNGADNIGVTGHLEMGIGGINKPDGNEETPFTLDLGLAYENSFFDRALDINAMLVYGIIFIKAPGMDGKEQLPQLLRLVFMTGYNHNLGDASTLSAIVQNENYIMLAPNVGDDIASGVIKPGIKFGTNIENVGNLFAQAGVPFAYLNFGQEKGNTWVGLDFTVGWMSTFGLGLNTSFHFMFSPEGMGGQTINGFTGVAVNALFMVGQFIAQARAAIPVKGMDTGARYSYFEELTSPGGMAVNLQLGYFFIPGLQAYAGVAFAGMGITGQDMIVSPMIGIDYSF